MREDLYGPRARKALRAGQPFYWAEQASSWTDDERRQHYADNHDWSELRRLRRLNNIDKHRRLPALLVGWPGLFYFGSDEGDNTRFRWGQMPPENDTILCYLTGPKAKQTRLHHEFALVLSDDPTHRPHEDREYQPQEHGLAARVRAGGPGDDGAGAAGVRPRGGRYSARSTRSGLIFGHQRDPGSPAAAESRAHLGGGLTAIQHSATHSPSGNTPMPFPGLQVHHRVHPPVDVGHLGGRQRLNLDSAAGCWRPVRPSTARTWSTRSRPPGPGLPTHPARSRPTRLARRRSPRLGAARSPPTEPAPAGSATKSASGSSANGCRSAPGSG